MENVKRRGFLVLYISLAILLSGILGFVPSPVHAMEEPVPAPDMDPPVTAAQTPGEDMVGSEAELEQWCYDHDGIGGTVYLKNNITIEYGVSGGYGGGHIVIDTGEYGLIYDGGNIALYDFEIIGEGVDQPVVTMIDAGYFWMGNWNNSLAFTSITATGRGGIGGVALHVVRDDGAPFDMNMVSFENSYIRSYGDGAVGILADEPMDLYCFCAEVGGANSVAVSAPAGTVLYFCRLSAEGAGAATATGPVTLDTCTASPQPEGAIVIDRAITDVSGKRFHMFVQPNDFIWPEAFFTFWLTGSDGSEVKRVFMVDWDLDAIDAIDSGAYGTHTIPGSLDPVYEGFGLTDDFPLALTIEVRDPALPTISAVYFSDWNGNVATLDLWNDYDPAVGGFILWRSDDEGLTWYDCTDSQDLVWLEWYKRVVEYHYDEITNPIMFCLEAGGTYSNVVTLYEKDGMPYGDTGGDRTAADREYVGADPGSEKPGGEGKNNKGSNTGNNTSGATNTGNTYGYSYEAYPADNNDGNAPANSSGAGTATEVSAFESPIDDADVPAASAGPAAETFDPTAPSNGPPRLLIIFGITALICFGVLAWLKLSRFIKAKQ